MSAWCSRTCCRDPRATVPHLCSPVQHHAMVLVVSGAISSSNSQYYVAACLPFSVPGLAQPTCNLGVSALRSINSLGLQQLWYLWMHKSGQGSSESLADSLPLGLSGKEEELSLASNSAWSPRAPSTQCFSLMLLLVPGTALSTLWMLSEQS